MNFNEYDMHSTLDTYLTETKLGEILDEWFPGRVLRQFRLNRYRIDFMIELESARIAVEFDGFKHYTDVKTQLRDQIVHAWCGANDVMFIQIPYWMQLSANSAEFYFGEFLPRNHKLSDEPDFPHGFVSKSCVLPADFNSVGWHRFCAEYRDFIDCDRWSLAQDVYDSIWYKIEKANEIYDDISIAKYAVMGIENTAMTRSDFLDHYPT